MSTEGNKNDMGKLRFDLIEPNFTVAVAKVLTFGANKYGANNWQKLDKPVERYYAALQRHLNAFRSGEAIDKESGLSHLAHAATNIMFLMYFMERPKETHDIFAALYKMPKEGPKPKAEAAQEDELTDAIEGLYQVMKDVFGRGL